MPYLLEAAPDPEAPRRCCGSAPGDTSGLPPGAGVEGATEVEIFRETHFKNFFPMLGAGELEGGKREKKLVLDCH